MSLDPRNIPTNPDQAAAERVGVLERRLAAAERAPRTVAKAGAPAVPSLTVSTARNGEVVNTEEVLPSGGTAIIDNVANRAYYWNGSAWKSVAVT